VQQVIGQILPLAANNPVIMAILLLVFGTVLIGKGIAQL
jgi:hypothetical protein